MSVVIEARCERLSWLDVLRGVAALLVVFFHVYKITNEENGQPVLWGMFDWGGCGVDLFFVLSGFIMVFAHYGEFGVLTKARAYFLKRFFRIYPAVWIMSAFSLFFYMFVASFGKESKLALWSIIESFFLLPQPQMPLVGQTWTLQYEIFFYVLFSSFFIKKEVGIAVIALWQAAVFFGGALMPHPEFPYSYLFNSANHEFLIGILAAFVLLNATSRRLLNKFKGNVLAVAAMGTFVVFGAHLLPFDASVRMWGVALSSAALIIGCVLHEQNGGRAAPNLLFLVGSASYSIYITHFAVIKILVKLLERAKIDVSRPYVSLGVAVCAVVAGVFFFLWVERPISRWGRRFGQKYNEGKKPAIEATSV